MNEFHLPATPCTPEILLSPLLGLLTMRGESYPENVLSFYAPILEQLRMLLEEQKGQRLRVEMHITYYNSASAKAIHRIFQMLNKAAENGYDIKLLWHYDEEDDMARDLGKDLQDDFQAIEFVDMPLTAA
jgi:hypothetical protein